MNVPALTLLFAAALLGLSACDGTPFAPSHGDALSPAWQTVVVRRDGNETAVALKPGQTLVLEFNMNASTGYVWNLKTPLSAGVLTGGAFEDASSPWSMPGAAGVRRFTFKAAMVGKQDLAFDFSGGGDRDPGPNEQAVFHVTVDN